MHVAQRTVQAVGRFSCAAGSSATRSAFVLGRFNLLALAQRAVCLVRVVFLLTFVQLCTGAYFAQFFA
ncbi:hypothetical protein A2U01_0102489 [Trifolium medium]|uniref:Uncharacterized protein n=1 Tax=Trifolium medium TaxID=97028 RepID=A0A392UYX1_9FABA|nr:hypothetical protein [Trifolium medium]